MPPGFVPPARAGSMRIAPPSIARPQAPRLAQARSVTGDQLARQNAMSAFHTALQQLQNVTPQVDANAIRAPYQAASVATGQLGQGLQAALAQSGQAAQQQYTQGLGEAQKQAAQFGISAGSGAQPAALQNTGTQLLAQQSQAQQAAAPMAATAWQNTLERSAAAKVADAGLQRSNLIASGTASLAGAIPGAIGAEKTRQFQAKTQRENMGLARSQLTLKQQNDLQNYLLGAARVQTSASAAATRATQTSAAQAETARHNRATENTAQNSLAIRARAQTATAKGLRGVAGAVKALSGTSTTGTKPVNGYKVTFLADPNGVSAGGPPVTLTVKDPNKALAPSGYMKPAGTAAVPVYGPSGSKASQAITRSSWDTQMRSLLAQNPGQAGAIKTFLGPRPKK